MNKLAHLLLLLPITFVFLLASIEPVSALELQSIGSSAVTNQNLTQWWYTAENPRLVGTAAANSSVTITIDSVANTVTADASGNWSYQPSTLTTGDHTVTITGDGETRNFTIHIGSTAPTPSTETKGASGSAQTLPQSGSVTTTLAMIGSGVVLMIAGLKLKKVSL